MSPRVSVIIPTYNWSSVLPAGIWHGLQNLGAFDSLVVNCPTKAYNYEDPDHYRLPFDSPEIPYTWAASGAAGLRSDALR